MIPFLMLDKKLLSTFIIYFIFCYYLFTVRHNRRMDEEIVFIFIFLHVLQKTETF